MTIRIRSTIPMVWWHAAVKKTKKNNYQFIWFWQSDSRICTFFEQKDQFHTEYKTWNNLEKKWFTVYFKSSKISTLNIIPVLVERILGKLVFSRMLVFIFPVDVNLEDFPKRGSGRVPSGACWGCAAPLSLKARISFLAWSSRFSKILFLCFPVVRKTHWQSWGDGVTPRTSLLWRMGYLRRLRARPGCLNALEKGVQKQL